MTCATLYWVDLSEAEALSQDIAGGKGAGLAALAQAGLPVPPTWIVTTAAWRCMLADHPNLSAWFETQGISGSMREFYQLPLPAALSEALTGIPLSTKTLLACRSSAVGEDGTKHSFAGLLSSALGLPSTGPGLVAGIKTVWRSMLTPRFRTYMENSNMDWRATIRAGTAVVVQPLLPVSRAGICFLRSDKATVEATWGLGVGAVAGMGQVDRYIWHPEGWKQQVAQGKRVLLWPTQPEWARLLPGDRILLNLGGELVVGRMARYHPRLTAVALPIEFGNKPILQLQEAEALRQLGIRAGEALGMESVDLEWGWTEAGPILLQARPVTTFLANEVGEVVDGCLVAASGEAEGLLWSPRPGSGPPDVSYFLYVPEFVPDLLPYLTGAAGVIAHTGGYLSHGAILCREWRKPFVVVAGTQRLQSGIWRIDTRLTPVLRHLSYGES